MNGIEGACVGVRRVSYWTKSTCKRLRVIAKVTVQRAAEAEIDLPDFQTFWQGGVLRIDPDKVPPRTFTLERFSRRERRFAQRGHARN